MNLTDSQLADLGAKAASIILNRPERVDYFAMVVSERSSFYDRDELARTAFAKAVREPVEAKQAEEIARLIAEVASWRAGNNGWHETSDKWQAECEKADAELAKATAELERLRHRPISTPPTVEDADLRGQVLIYRGNGAVESAPWDAAGFDPRYINACPDDEKFVSWMRIYPPPAPTAEKIQRDKFNAWYDARCQDPSQHKTALREAMFDSWQAALVALPPAS